VDDPNSYSSDDSAIASNRDLLGSRQTRHNPGNQSANPVDNSEKRTTPLNLQNLRPSNNDEDEDETDLKFKK